MTRFRSAALLALSLMFLGCGGNVAMQEALGACNQRLIEMTAQCSQSKSEPCPACPACPTAKKGDLPAVIDVISNEDLGKLITSVGFQFRGHTQNAVKFIMPGPGGQRIAAVVHNSKGNLRLYAAFIESEPPPLGLVNEWNRTKRYSRAHVDSDGDPVIESGLDIRGGVTPKTIQNFVKIFGISAGAFRAELVKGRST